MMSDLNPDKIVQFRQARRRVWLPFGAAVLGVSLIVAVTALIAVGHVGVVSNTLLVTLCLLPLVILMAPLVIATFLGIWGVSRLDKAAVQRLIQAERAAADIKGRAQVTAKSMGSRIIGVAAAVERLEPLWRLFDRDDEKKGRGDEYPQTAKPNQPAGSN